MKKIIVALFVVFVGKVYAEQSLLVYSNTTGQVVYQQDINLVRPLASITKIMTAMVAMDYDKDLTRRLKLSNRVGGTLPLSTYTRYELLTAMLVRSDNAAAETLADDYPGGRKAFIQTMNYQAERLGMINTRFDDPTGLSAQNISTASEIASMMNAVSEYWLIKQISTRQQANFTSLSKTKPKTVTLHNTNVAVLQAHDTVVASKTGFTSRAGWCVTMLVEQAKQTFTIVVLGSKSKSHRVQTVEWLMYNHLTPIEDDGLFLSHPNNFRIVTAN